jgi:predicted lipoprotein with Yx(FWY)xxD motif
MARMLGGRMRPAAIVSIGVVLLFSACAKSSTPASGGGSTAPSQGGSAQVGTGSVSGMGTVLVDAKGLTLYYLKTETSGKIMCTGSCASAWPPLLLPAGTTSATAGSGVSGKLGTIDRPDGGTQVTYNGLPLYTFTSDQGPGQATGQGVNGFYVMTPTGPSTGAGGGTGGGGGY